MTQVKWTKQAGLAAALLALGSAAYWLEYKHKPEAESKEEASKKVFQIKDVKVDSMAIHDGAGHVFQIQCSDQTAKLCKPGDNSKWEISAPYKLKADDSNVNALISSLNNLTTTETIDLKEDPAEKRAALLKEYGLDAQSRALSSTRKVEVATPQGKAILYLGAQHPIGDSIFGMVEQVPAGQKSAGKVDETKVYLVPTYFKTNIEHDLTYWRDKKLMTASAHEIESFRLLGTKANVSGVKKDGLWTLSHAGTGTHSANQAGEFPGDIENIDNILTAAAYLTAKDFVSDQKSNPKAQGTLKGTKKILTLTLQQEKGSKPEAPAPITLAFFQKGSAPKDGKGPSGVKLYATVSNLDPLYELEPTALDRLDKSVKDLRLAKLITSMERFTAKKLDFSGKPLQGKALMLKNQDGKWVQDGTKGEVSNDRVQNLLDKLSGNRIQEFMTTIPAGEADGLTLKLADDKTEAKRQLVFWRAGGKLYARDLASKRKEAFVVDPAVADELPWAADHFVKKADPVAAPSGAPVAPKPPGLDSHAHGPAGSPPEPGKPLIPVPDQKEKK